MNQLRTRFAPSPTGYLHVGGIRTAVFSWLLARQSGGDFILRLEDTDKRREVAGSDEHLMRSLKTLGLDYDEGPDIGGPHAPYRQSERLDVYKRYAQKLVDQGRAYADPYTSAQVQTFREQAETERRPFLYRHHRPESPPQWDGTQPLRFTSSPRAYQWHDAIMGNLASGPEVIDDFVLIKSDGYPTYNFAHLVDDAEMAVTHIIRGQEFLASVPNYLNLYEALGLHPPVMATVPPVLGPDGKRKLSKRDGAKDVLDYIYDGFLPEALLNFIATLGWNDGTTQEIFSPAELIAKFSLERVGRGGARFDERRLLWMNGYYIRHMSLEKLYEKVKAYWPAEAKSYDDAYRRKVLALVQERLKFFAELPELSMFFFKDLPVSLESVAVHKQLKRLSSQKLHDLLQRTKERLQSSNFSVQDLTSRLNQLLIETNQKPAVLFSLIRIATTQAPASPGLAETMAVLGKKRSLERINTTLKALAQS